MYIGFIVPLISHLLVTRCHGQTVAFEDWQSGSSTFYTGIDGGHCSYGTISTSSFPYGYIVAPNTNTYSNSDACGRCYEIQCVSSKTDGCNGCTIDDTTGENKIVTVLVTDECPSCEDYDDQFDLSESAFDLIADTGCGVINMQYRQVSCDILTENIIIENKDGVNAWWYALYVTNVANYGEISKVELMDSSGDNKWYNGESTDYNAWVFTNSNGFESPLTIRVYDSSGEYLTGENVVTNFEGEYQFDFGSNFAVTTTTITDTDTDTSNTDTDTGNTGNTNTNTNTNTDNNNNNNDNSDTSSKTDTSSNTDDSNNIIIQNKDGINQWWYALYVHNLADGNTIKTIEIQDSNSDLSGNWYDGESTSYGAWVWQSSESNGWETPFSMKITNTDGDTLYAENVITDTTEYSEFDFGSNFDAVVSMASYSTDGNNNDGVSEDASSTQSENKSLKDELLTLEWILGLIIGVVVICLIIGGICWYKKRQKNNTHMQATNGHYVAL